MPAKCTKSTFSITQKNKQSAVYSTLEESTHAFLLGTFHWLSDDASHTMNDALYTPAKEASVMTTQLPLTMTFVN